MPELPEVETVVRDLRPLLIGQTIEGISTSSQALRRPWNPAWNPKVLSRTIAAISRRGKWILVSLSDDSRLVLHLGMTGQLTVHLPEEAQSDHVHFRFRLQPGNTELRFRDIRRFGLVVWYPDEATWLESMTEKLGPEPFDLQPVAFRESLNGSSRNLKALLLDQSIVAGVGNIYADESLFRAGLNPRQTGRQTTPPQAEALRLAIIGILTTAIEGRGSTIRDYVGGSGLQGNHQRALQVYGRTGEACTICQTNIECIRLAGRSTHYCPKCQKSEMNAGTNNSTNVRV